MKGPIIMAVAASLVGTAAVAADYPTRDITAVVVWAAGGGTDVATRVLAAEMQEHLPVRINVTNRTGGVAGSVGLSYAYNQPNDGYTIMGFADANVTAAVQGGWEERFAVWHPWVIGGSPSILSVSAEAAYRTLDELIEAARADPGQILATAAAAGSIHHLNLLTIEQAADIAFNFIPYPGSAPSQNAAMAGEVSVVVTSLAEQMQLLEAGRLRPLALMSDEAQEIGDFGRVPTAYEVVDGLEEGALLMQMLGIAVRDDAPDEVKETLDAAFRQALASEPVQAWAEANAYTLSGLSGKEAQDELTRREQIYSWQLYDLDIVTISPDTLGIERP